MRVYQCKETYDNYREYHIIKGRLYMVEEDDGWLYIYDTTKMHGRLIPTICYGKIGRCHLQKYFRLIGEFESIT